MNFGGKGLFPHEKTAPLSWVTYSLFGLIFVVAGLTGYINMFLALVVRPEESMWLKGFIAFSMLMLPVAFIGMLLVPSKAKLAFFLLILISAAGFLGYISGVLGAREEQELFAMAIPMLWIGIYSFTRVPVSIRQRRIKKHQGRPWL